MEKGLTTAAAFEFSSISDKIPTTLDHHNDNEATRTETARSSPTSSSSKLEDYKEPLGGPVAQSIESKLTAAFKPSVLKIVDESHKHAGHMQMKDHSRAGETHFKVTIVSDEFEGKALI